MTTTDDSQESAESPSGADEPETQTPAPAQTPKKPTPTPGTVTGVVRTAAPATSFGEVGPDGTIFLRLPDGSQREVGQWAAGDPQEGLEFFARKYGELVTEIDLAAKRLADDRSTPERAEATAERIRKAV
ncbi:MAG: hypothetical protein ACJAY5_001148, partial [Actinomycetes bacterium]